MSINEEENQNIFTSVINITINLILRSDFYHVVTQGVMCYFVMA